MVCGMAVGRVARFEGGDRRGSRPGGSRALGSSTTLCKWAALTPAVVTHPHGLFPPGLATASLSSDSTATVLPFTSGNPVLSMESESFYELPEWNARWGGAARGVAPGWE